jgi:chromate transporter
LVQAIFFGLKPAVMAVVVEAVIRIGKRAFKNEVMIILAGLAFVAIFFFDIAFPIIIVSAGLIGFIGGKFTEDKFHVIKGHQSKVGEGNEQGDFVITDSVGNHTQPSLLRAIRVTVICLLLWFVPLALLISTYGKVSVFVTEGIFFSKAAVVTFGGAYAVLAYIAQEAVNTYGWLKPGEMLDGLGMAETTPGPLIMVLQFVGFMGAYRHPDAQDPMLAGVLGSIITTWVTFVPCFLWIFLGAPYIEYLRGNKSLSTALSSITAAVVGVILNLAVWFSLHTLFRSVNEIHTLGMRLQVPVINSIDLVSLLIAIGAFVAMFRYRLSMIPTLTGSAFIGLVYYLTFRS